MNADQINEIVRLHGLWLAGINGGVRANLRDANLSGANLSGADLRYADLRYANLRGTIGDGSIIRTIQTGVYVVVICGPMVSIGCQSHNWSDWMGFNDTSIHNMDQQKAVDFWRIWKPILTAITEVR